MFWKQISLYRILISIVILNLLLPNIIHANTLTMALSGYIKDRCEINFKSGNIMSFSNNEQTQSLPFSLYCNRPLGMTITSKYGGLKHQKEGLDLIEQYRLSVQMDALNIDESRRSKQLISPSIIEDSSGVIPFSQKGMLKVTLENNLLFAGYYQDVIEIEVYPSIHSVMK